MAFDSPITLGSLPLGNNVTFKDSGFFTRQTPPETQLLPSPQEVRQDDARQHLVLHGTELGSQGTRPRTVRYPTSRLLVKYGLQVSIAEAQCLWMLRKHVPGVPVPEVYRWCQEGDEDHKTTFIYMELIEGMTLEEGWSNLSKNDRKAVCRELRGMVDA